jgi:hypothetical protein
VQGDNPPPPRVVDALSLTTKVALTVTAPGMLVGTRKHLYRVYTSSNVARERLWVKHTITERSASAWITVVALHPVVFGLSYLYFPKGGTMVTIIK